MMYISKWVLGLIHKMRKLPLYFKNVGSRIPFPCYVSTLQECLINFLDEKLQHRQSGSCKKLLAMEQLQC